MFSELLQGIVEETPGAVGAVLMGYDGIAIDQYFLPQDEVDLNILAIEYANVLKEVKQMTEVLDTGFLEEVSIKTANYYIVLRAISPEYFVFLTVNSHGNVGKGKYLIMRDAVKIREALS